MGALEKKVHFCRSICVNPKHNVTVLYDVNLKLLHQTNWILFCATVTGISVSFAARMEQSKKITRASELILFFNTVRKIGV